MDRRSFLCDVGAAALGAAWPLRPVTRSLGGYVSYANVLPGAASVAVFDPTLAEGRMLAHRARCAGCAAWAVGDSDIGGLWHGQLARRLESGASLIGALRPSDRFVLARLAATRRVTLHEYAPEARMLPAKSDSQDCAHRT
jgi:hypothetical protein